MAKLCIQFYILRLCVLGVKKVGSVKLEAGLYGVVGKVEVAPIVKCFGQWWIVLVNTGLLVK